MNRVLLMIQFLTRIPIPFEIPCEKEDFSKAVVWFPLVGWMIGGILMGLAFGLTYLNAPFLQSVILVVAAILVTGGLHLDGLADTFDGLYSNRPKERILEIMKDSHIGAYGVLALIVVLALKAALLMAISPAMVPWAVLIMPVSGRLSVVWLSKFFSPARKNGMGNFFIGQVSVPVLLIATLIAALPLIFLGWTFVEAIGGTVIFALVYGRHASKVIDGITGDVLGATCELSEVCFLLLIFLLTSI